MNLYKHQIEALDWLEKRPKAILALDAGLGKSAIAIKTFKDNERILIICPATLKLNWVREIKLWSSRTDITIIKTKKDELKPGINIINYDLLGKKVKKRAVANFDFKGFDRVILDESHRIKNAKAVRTKIGAKIVKNIKNAILLTGTLGERSMDLYVPLISIDAIDMNMHSFGMKYCDGKKVYLGMREVWDYRGNTNSSELRRLIKPKTLIMHKEDVIDLPEKTINIIELDAKVSRREREYDVGAILKDPRAIGFEGLAELIHEQALAKLPLAIKHIKMRLENTDKLFIVARHTDVIDILLEKLEKFNPVKLDGRDNLNAKQTAVDTFQTDKTCQVFIGQIVASGVGITLTAASNVIFVETDWSYSNISQAGDRCHRIGQKNNVHIEILTVANSIDQRILYTTLEKKQFTEEVLR